MAQQSFNNFLILTAMDLREKGHLYKKAYKELKKMTIEELNNFLKTDNKPDHWYQAARDIIAER